MNILSATNLSPSTKRIKSIQVLVLIHSPFASHNRRATSSSTRKGFAKSQSSFHSIKYTCIHSFALARTLSLSLHTSSTSHTHLLHTSRRREAVTSSELISANHASALMRTQCSEIVTSSECVPGIVIVRGILSITIKQHTRIRLAPHSSFD